jgi:hypothetical protein
VSLVESNHMVEQLTAAAPHPNAQPHHSAKGFVPTSARIRSASIEAGPVRRIHIWHHGQRSETSGQIDKEKRLVIAAQSSCS